MATFIFAFIILALLIAGMAIGVMLQGKPIKGSCGGMSALGIDTECDICGGDPNKCEKESAEAAAAANPDLAYNAAEYQAAESRGRREAKSPIL